MRTKYSYHNLSYKAKPVGAMSLEIFGKYYIDKSVYTYDYTIRSIHKIVVDVEKDADFAHWVDYKMILNIKDDYQEELEKSRVRRRLKKFLNE